MKKVDDAMSMEVNGGHSMVYYSGVASRSGSAAVMGYCSRKGHTYVHAYSRTVYCYGRAAGRQYTCLRSGCW